jgi:hypothetical protein
MFSKLSILACALVAVSAVSVGITSNGGGASGYVTSVDRRRVGFHRLSIALVTGVTIWSAR